MGHGPRETPRLGGAADLKLLLDTHIWLWSLHDPKLLGKRIQNELRDPANELWLSPISTWEALTLNAKGRIRRGNLAEWVAHATAPFHEAPLTHDRFLAATAQVLDLTLVTADVGLLGLGEIATLGNR